MILHKHVNYRVDVLAVSLNCCLERTFGTDPEIIAYNIVSDCNTPDHPQIYS